MSHVESEDEKNAREMMDALDALISNHVVDQGSVELGWMMRGMLDQFAQDPMPDLAGEYREDYEEGQKAAAALRSANRI